MSSLEFDNATSLTIGYMLDDERHEFTIADPSEVRAILDAIEVTRTRPGVQVGFDPFGWVDFHFDDHPTIKTIFVHANHLDRAHWGQVELTHRFYDAVNAAATRHAGRPIDVVKDN